MPDDPMTDDELAEYVAARYRQLITRGLTGGAAAVHEKVEQLADEDVRLLLALTIRAEVNRIYAAGRATVIASNQ